MVKPHNESLVWYDAAAYEAAGGLTASGTSAYPLGAAEGAALMDLFEDIYLGTAGPDFYDLLVGREIPWTHETVVGALQMLVQVAGDDEDIAGGIEGALATDFSGAVGQLEADPPAAAQLFAGDRLGADLGDGVVPAPFPATGEGPTALVTGDQVVMFRYSRVSEDLLSYLVTPEATDAFISRGLPTLARDVDLSAYPDPVTRIAVAGLRDAGEYRYDLSELLPEELASTEGEGLLPLFRELMRDPDDVEGIAERMEAAAQEFYKD
jgi:alpha-glucoside transport system substrate-binding protein